METFEKSLFGTLAVSKQFLTRQQLDEALAAQAAAVSKGGRPPRLGEILVSRGFLTDEQLRSLLSIKTGGGGSLFGEIAESWGLCSGAQIDAALALQIEYRLQRRRPPRIGEILLTRNALKTHQIHSVLKAQGKQVVQCPGCSTSYNALHVKEGSTVLCPRCNNTFTPIPPPTESVVDGEPIVDVRSDATAFLPAVGDDTEDTTSLNAVVLPELTAPQYKIESRLGVDASGLLYKAHDTARQKPVTLRVIAEDPKGDAGLEAWRQAAVAANELSHPGLQRVLHADFDKGRLVVASEYYQGQSLRKILQRGGKLEVGTALDLLIQTAEALSFGLSKEVVHGDLRPNRVIVDESNRVHVSGLGMPKRIHDDLKLLTRNSGAAPLYASPEVLRNAQAVSAQSDVYSLAAIGYHLVTGRAPQIASLTHRGQLRSAPPKCKAPNSINPHIPPYVSRLLLKGLSRNPDDRYPSAREFLEDLKTAREALKNNLKDVPGVAPAFTRPGGTRGRSRVGTGVRGRRHKTAWRSQGGARLTLSDPPPPAPVAPASDAACEARRAAANCPSPAESGWTSAHTVATVSVALLLLAASIVLLRPARAERTDRANAGSTAQDDDTNSNHDIGWILKRDLEDSVITYKRQNPKDYNGIRYRADQFIRQHAEKHPDAEAVRTARSIRLSEARKGAADTRRALQKTIHDLLQQDRFEDALNEVSRWGAYWGKEAVGLEEQAFRNYIRGEQKSHASAWLDQGRAQRDGGSWEKARETFAKVEADFGTEYAEQARREKALTDQAEERAKADKQDAATRGVVARVQSQREAAAPVLLRKLVSDLHAPIGALNFKEAWRIVADAEPGLTRTSKALDYQNIRTTISRIEGLRDRTIKAAVAGDLRDFTLQVNDWSGQIVDGSSNGFKVKSGDVEAEATWASLKPETVVRLFERCTDDTSASEVLDLALFHLHRGDLESAQGRLEQAECLGAMVDHQRDLIPLVDWVARVNEAQIPVAERNRHLNELAATKSALRGMEWDISRGKWEVNPDLSFVGTPDAGMTLMSLRRNLKNFERIEVEVRGDGDAVGFSFGTGKRFLSRPIYVWQKLSLHNLPGNRLELRVDGEPRDSLEAVKAVNLEFPTDLYLRGLGQRIEFRNFAIDGKIIRPSLGPAPKPAPATPSAGAEAGNGLSGL